MSKEIIEGALYMASKGYHVFPLLGRLQNDKNVRGTPKGWNHNASDDPKSIPSTTKKKKIKAWASKYRDLIGYGVNPRGRRAIILDVDIKDGKVGAESLKALVKDFNINLNTFCVKTKSGGLHLYYDYTGVPEGFYVKGTNIESYPDIDLRCDNSFVNGPYEGGSYTIIKDVPEIALPEKLVERLPLQSLDGFSTKISSSSSESLTYADDLLKGIIPDKIYKGERDNTLIRLIGSWARKYPFDTTVILTKEAISRCEGDDISIEDYIPKIESTYAKDSFKPTKPDLVEWLEDHLILIPEKKSICDLSQPAHKSVILKEAAADRYRNWIYYVENPNTGRKTKVYAFKTWIESPNRKTYSSYGYYPKDVPDYYCDIQDCQVVNTYSPPFRDIKVEEIEVAKYKPYIDKFIDFCNELFEDEADFMLDWVAHQVQKPYEKLTIAPVLISEVRGVGKNLFFDIIKNMVGKWNTTEADVSEAIDKFCEFPLRHHLVLINEVNVDTRDRKGVNSRREMMERLKNKITENMQSVEPKFVGRFNVQSYIDYLIVGNNMDGLPVEEGDRRFHVIKIEAGRHKREYYDMLWELARSFVEDSSSIYKSLALRQYFLERKITSIFKGDVAVQSVAKQEMIDAGKSAEQLNLDEAIRDHYSIFRSNIITKELFYWYVTHKMPQGNRLSSGAINDLFRNNFVPILQEKGSRRAKQLRVKLPDVTIGTSIMPEEVKRCALYTVRNHYAYNFNNADPTWLKAEYNKALEATAFGFKQFENEDEKTKSV